MPSTRNRILGIQLYKFDIVGFLQWGYNFWYSQYSKYPIDPFKVTDAGQAFPSGDAFAVYPGEDRYPLESLRLLEELIGREAVIEMLEEGLDEPISFRRYPTDDEWLLKKREQINRKIAELI